MDPSHTPNVYHATTIVSVRREGRVAVAGDGQVTLGHTVMKGNARKVRRLGREGQVLAGFAGAAADAFALFELFEAKLDKHGQLTRAAVELAKDWRTERRLGKLEALLIVADKETSLIIGGTGDVIEPEDGIVAIGSGGPYALSAARALVARTQLDARTIAVEALNINGLARGMLAGHVQDAGWAQFLEILACKAESAGRELVRVNPAGTSQQCSACGAQVPKDLRVRVHRCPGCGYVADRDVNAARNILRLVLRMGNVTTREVMAAGSRPVQMKRPKTGTPGASALTASTRASSAATALSICCSGLLEV